MYRVGDVVLVKYDLRALNYKLVPGWGIKFVHTPAKIITVLQEESGSYTYICNYLDSAFEYQDSYSFIYVDYNKEQDDPCIVEGRSIECGTKVFYSDDSQIVSKCELPTIMKLALVDNIDLLSFAI